MTVTVSPAPGILQKTFDALPPAGKVTVRLRPGVYREKAMLCRPDTVVEGSGAAVTRITWGDGAKTILSDGFKRGTFRTATLLLAGKNITIRGVTVENSAAPRESAGQAIALYADGDGFTAEDCVFTGSQDTLFTAPLPPREIEKRGFIGPREDAPRLPQRQTYRRCRITGDIDFIFGGASAWFEDCDIIARDGRSDRSQATPGYCTAPSTPEGVRFGYIFHRCRFRNVNFPPRSVYLGRPWREYAKTILLDCELDSHICPEHFDDWNKPAFHELGVAAEYGSTGPGASGKPASFVRTLTEAEARAITYEAFRKSLEPDCR